MSWARIRLRSYPPVKQVPVPHVSGRHSASQAHTADNPDRSCPSVGWNHSPPSCPSPFLLLPYSDTHKDFLAIIVFYMRLQRYDFFRILKYSKSNNPRLQTNLWSRGWECLGREIRVPSRYLLWSQPYFTMTLRPLMMLMPFFGCANLRPNRL